MARGRGHEIGDLLVVLLLFFLCENLHDMLVVFGMGKWDAIEKWEKSVLMCMTTLMSEVKMCKQDQVVKTK